ncbi:MAG: sugar phosphate isomerase/epimerase [Planctomycetes bacterium]|nr:sugar phosphate isomerase/epimerase [Planctomycetota bacterium]
MGIQSYSLRGFQVTDDALAKTKELGLRYWESYSAHFPMTDAPATLAEYKKKLADHGITLMAYGVQNFGKDTSANRKQFEFAKAMGISTISANPEPDSFDNLDKLVEEFGINIAIHNHGSNDKRYGKVDQVLKAIMNHNERIGACVDTGHYIHADEDPVKAIEAFGHRTYGVHLKDVKKLPDGKKEYTVLGRGDLDVVGCLKQLKRLKFDLCLSLEYEGNEKNPIADIRECLAVVQEAVKKV